MTESRYFLALAERQAGDYPQAIASLQEVVSLQPKNGMAWNLLGDALAHQARQKEAIAAWRHAVSIDPEDTRSIASLVVALRPSDPAEAARFEAQLTAVEKARHISGRAQALASEAIVSMRADDWPDATRYLQQAIQICPDCAIKAELHKSLGLMQCDLGDLDHGEAELRIARTLKRGDPQIDRALALIAQVRADHSSSGSSASSP
jgi:tetratricopeptide (TPR) repeat protein